jgi:hypothetical protein
MRRLIICSLQHRPVTCKKGNQIKKSEMGETCKTYGRDEKCTRKFYLDNINGRFHFEVLGVDGEITDLKVIGCNDEYWIHLA